MPEGAVTGELLEGVVREHFSLTDRYRRLKEYYLGKTDIGKRSRAPGLPNNRLSHAFARYIVTVTAGYLVGQGIGKQVFPLFLSVLRNSGYREALLQVTSSNHPAVRLYERSGFSVRRKIVYYNC